MGLFSKFERKVEDGVEGAASAFEKSALTPVQITKKAEKQMRREKVLGAGRQIAPTLYTCLVSPEDDARLFGYYPTLAGEVETYLQAKADDNGFSLDCKPLVRFVPDPDLHKGKFDVIAELVAAPIITELRAEENARYGISPKPAQQAGSSPQSSNVNQQKFENPRERGNAQANSQVPASNAPAQTAAPAQTSVRTQQKTTSPSDDKFAGLDVFSDPSSYAQPEVQKSVAATPASPAPMTSVDVQNTQRSVVPDATQISPPVQDLASVQSQVSQPRQRGAVAVPYVVSSQATVSSDPTQAQTQSVKDVYFYDAENDIAYSLTGASEKIGRESTNEIVVSDINASRTHAEIHMEQTGVWVITDLGSTNGLYVNGNRVKSVPLRDADVVLVGTTRLEFQDLR